MPTCSLSTYLAASAKSGVTLFRQIVTLRAKPGEQLVIYDSMSSYYEAPFICTRACDLSHIGEMHACMQFTKHSMAKYISFYGFNEKFRFH